MDNFTATTQTILPACKFCEELLVMDARIRGIHLVIQDQVVMVVNALYEDDRLIILQELEAQALSSSASIIII